MKKTKINKLANILWQDVLDEINTPIPNQVYSLAQSLKKSVEDMSDAASNFSDLPKEDLKQYLSYIQQENKTEAELNQALQKHAQLWELGKQTLRAMPVIGFIFSFLFAFKNFIYTLSSFAILLEESKLIGLDWIEVLDPENLRKKIGEYQDNPEKMKILVRLTKYVLAFVDEGISAITNGLDFVKDVIFLFVDLGSFGWAIVGDVGISVVLSVLEWVAKSQRLPVYQAILSDIKMIADNKIFESTELSQDDLYNYFLAER